MQTKNDDTMKLISKLKLAHAIGRELGQPVSPARTLKELVLELNKCKGHKRKTVIAEIARRLYGVTDETRLAELTNALCE